MASPFNIISNLPPGAPPPTAAHPRPPWLRVKFFGGPNYQELKRIVGGGRIAAVLDDLPEMIDVADKLGIQTILHDQPYNCHYEHVWRAADMAEAQDMIMIWLDKWKQDHG